jgi:peptidoglycan/LPS O-acetylase OafA/YrhL
LWLITHVIKNKEKAGGTVVKFLSTNLLVFIGKISYGIYLYHLYIPWLRQFLLRPLIGDYHSGLDRPIIFTLFFIFDLLLLFSIAFLSWKFIEQPILSFKKYFVIRNPPAKKITSLLDT